MIVNLVIIGILLLFLIIGFVKGFVKQLFGFVGGILSFVLAAMFCGQIVDMLAGTEVFDKVKEFFMSLFPVAEEATIESLNLPEFILNLVKSFMEANAEATLAESVAVALTKLSLMFGAYVAIVIVVKLVAAILSAIFGAIFKKDVLGVINKLLGALVGVIGGVLVVCGILFIMELLQITQIEVVSEYLSSSELAQLLMQYNVYTILFSMITV